MSHATATAELLRHASQRLVRTVDSLQDDSWAVPSLLPDWSVAHVVAHVTLNAEGLTAALLGVRAGEPAPMYASQAARDRDIAELGAAPPAEIRDRLLAAVTRIEAALAALPADAAGTMIERTPGSGRLFPAGAVAAMRLREVEIHHADLHAGYSPADWPDEFTRMLLDHRARHWSGSGFRARADDLQEVWEFGQASGGGPEAVPVVTGPAHELAWWSTGRPPYPGTAGPTTDGVLPETERL